MGKNCCAAILSGGRASRMNGVDKAWLTVDGQPIVERQLAVLRQRFDAIAMVVGSRGDARHLNIVSLNDRVGGLGPLDGIASALAWSPQEWLMVVAADMPYLNLSILDALLAARTGAADIIATRASGRVQPLFALYHRRILSRLDECLKARQLKASQLLMEPPEGISVVWLDPNELLRMDPKQRAFKNLNRPKDLTNYEEIE